MKKSNLILILVLIFLTLKVNAQQNFIVSLKMPPPGTLNTSDFYNITVTNNSGSEQTGYLSGTAKEENDGMIVKGTTVPIIFKKGVNNIKIKDFTQTPDVEYLASDPRYKESLIRQGKFPSGVYEICVKVISSGSNAELGSDCINQEVLETGLLTLIIPSDGEDIDLKVPITFTWSSGGKVPDGGYSLRICEVMNNQTPEIAIKGNKAWFEKKGIKSTTFTYPNSAKGFESDKIYAWTVSGNGVTTETFAFMTSKEGKDISLEGKDLLIIESPAYPNLNYSYFDNRSNNPNDTDSYKPHHWFWKTNRHNCVNSPDGRGRGMVIQTNLDNSDYSSFTLQALEGEEVGLKFVHASSDPKYPVSSWVLPDNKMGLNDTTAMSGPIAKHGRLRSWWHSIPSTECDRQPHGVFGLINNDCNSIEEIVSYDLRSDGKYGFKIVDENQGNTGDQDSLLPGHRIVKTMWYHTFNRSGFRNLTLSSDTDSYKPIHWFWKTNKHNCVNSPDGIGRGKAIQTNLDNSDYSTFTLQALEGEEIGLKFIHASSDPKYPVSSWVLPDDKLGLNDTTLMAQPERIYGLIINDCKYIEEIVSYDLKDDGKYSLRITLGDHQDSTLTYHSYLRTSNITRHYRIRSNGGEDDFGPGPVIMLNPEDYDELKPRHNVPKSPGKHNAIKSSENQKGSFIQSNLDTLDYSKITLQVLDGEVVGLKFVHASYNTNYPVSSWILPGDETGLNDKIYFSQELATHSRWGSFWHKQAKSECEPFGKKFRLINNENNKEGIVTYELKEDGKFGFILKNNFITHEEFEKLDYSQIVLLDLGENKIFRHSDKKSFLRHHYFTTGR